MVINSFGRGPGDTDIPVSVRLIDTTGQRCSLLSTPDFDGRAAIAIRGNSSASFPKQPYKLELRDEGTNALKAPLLGMPSESDWILYPPYSDKTLMRNVLTYRLHEEMGHYAVRTRFVELFFDMFGGKLTRSADYRGVYVLVEKIKRDKGRVNIQRLEPTDLVEPNISGGYIFKKDKFDPGEEVFSTTHGIQFTYADPPQQDLLSAQKTWLRNWLNEFEAVLYGTNFKDPTNGYAKYIDVGSFLDQHWINEFTRNVDGYIFSNYMHKDRLGKLNVDPIWDYDLGLGNANYGDGWLTNGWHWSALDDANYPWFRRLFQDPDFGQRYTDRWTELRRGLFNTTNVMSRIDSIASTLNEAQVRNFQKWPVLGTYVWPNYYIGKTYESEVAWMKQWILGRLAWIDRNYVPPPAFNQPGGHIDPGFSLTATAPVGTIYYTTNGSDPRLPGGALGPNALAYTSPVTISSNLRVTARARYTNAWSGPITASFDVSSPALVITELMFHPPPPPASSPYATEDFEFVELMNVGNSVLDLRGIHFGAGITFSFTGGAVTSLNPGERVVIAKNIPAFFERYGGGVKLAGQYSGSLDNAGERVLLLTSQEKTILDFTYSGAWHPSTDGLGYSLTRVAENASASTWNDRFSWRPSTNPGGSPGYPDAPESYAAWRTNHFSPEQLADPSISGDTADPDQDGMMNRDEYAAGTDPLDPASRLNIEVVALLQPTGGAKLQFTAAPGRTYSVQYRDSVISGSWLKLEDIYAHSTATTIGIIDPASTAHGSRWYRLVCPATP